MTDQTKMCLCFCDILLLILYSHATVLTYLQGDTKKWSSPKLEELLKELINSFHFSDLLGQINVLRVYQI